VYGGAMAIAALVGAASALLLGRHIAAGHGRRGVVIAFSAISLTVLVRAASLGIPWLAVAANALSAVATCLLAPTVGVPVYNLEDLAVRARFNVAAEGGWTSAASRLSHRGADCARRDAAGVILPGFLGVLGQVLLLRRYYVTRRLVKGDCGMPEAEEFPLPATTGHRTGRPHLIEIWSSSTRAATTSLVEHGERAKWCRTPAPAVGCLHGRRACAEQQRGRSSPMPSLRHAKVRELFDRRRTGAMGSSSRSHRGADDCRLKQLDRASHSAVHVVAQIQSNPRDGRL
jgi:hypothetical protein